MFNNCESVEEAKTAYRELSKKNHPDAGGSEEMMKAINLEYEKFMNDFISGRINDFTADKDFDINSEPFAEILKKVIHFNMDIEIIGFWIYARNSFEVKDTLKELGFWFSKKHKAWVFSGSKKRNIRTRMTTDDIRNTHGSTAVRDRKENKKIA